MLTLSYGYKLPEAGDRGTLFYDAMEGNITRFNGHTHNGTDSPPLTAQSISGVTQAISSASWATYGGPIGFYRQLVTVPAGFDYDIVGISFRLSTGELIFPTVERVSDTQYYVYTNDNTLNYVAVYGG